MAANLPIVRDKVQRILAQSFNGVELGNNDDYTIRNESTRVFIRPWEQDNRVIINITAPVLFEVKPTPDLFKHIATHADDYIFGHLAAAEGEDGVMVLFTHSLLGDYLDEQELVQAVLGVGQVANQIDDELQGQFGGRTFHDS